MFEPCHMDEVGVSRAPARVKKQALAFVPPLLRFQLYIPMDPMMIHDLSLICRRSSLGPFSSPQQLPAEHRRPVRGARGACGGDPRSCEEWGG